MARGPRKPKDAGRPRGGDRNDRQERGGGDRGGADRGARKAPVRVPPGVVRVNGHSEHWLRQGFSWVYPNEVEGGHGQGSGVEVTLQGPGGAVLGRGLTDVGWLAVRRLRDDAGPLDDAWLAAVVDRAVRLRERLVLADHTTAARLVHAENDGLPGVRVDWWDGWVELVLDSPGVAPLVPALVRVLHARLPVRGVHLCYRPDPRDTLDAATFSPAPGWVDGAPPGGDVVVLERGLRMAVRPGDGPDVGSYPDMRDVRAWLAPWWSGQRVLNTFAYTGAFSAAALRAGAAEVTSVDLSQPYLDRLEHNLHLNDVDDGRHTTVQADAFQALDRFRRTGQVFDRVVLDPPSFSHGPTGTWSAKKDMPRLVAAAARVTAADGWIVAASNQGQLSPRAFRGLVAEGLAKAGRVARELSFHGAAVDHPAAVTHPEGHYLKVGVWALD
ncbi:MAG: class I SAM-dependent rRNA methyltransferase [Alphaproteobacteria bacterium]|nr:class I SAM-dependent rRNA methyltransferase [Alphaproteobacteria bacterium]